MHCGSIAGISISGTKRFCHSVQTGSKLAVMTYHVECDDTMFDHPIVFFFFFEVGTPLLFQKAWLLLVTDGKLLTSTNPGLVIARLGYSLGL